MADNKERGLYNKYNVTRTDGKSIGEAIILEFKDPIARIGIQAWANEMFAKGYTSVYYDVQEKLCEYENKK